MTILNKEVVGKIEEAVRYSDSAYASIRTAGMLASKELDKSLPLVDALDKVLLSYNEHFTGTNASNLRSIFKDAMLIAASPKVKVTLVSGKDKETRTVTTAGKVADGIAKHTLREVAKQVREARGLPTSGAKKAGRKSTSEAAETPKVSVATLEMTPARVSEFALVDRVAEAIAKPEWRSDLAQVMVATLGLAKSREALEHLTAMLADATPKRKRTTKAA